MPCCGVARGLLSLLWHVWLREQCVTRAPLYRVRRGPIYRGFDTCGMVLHPAYRAVWSAAVARRSLGPVLSACHCCEEGLRDMKYPHERCHERERGPRFFGWPLCVCAMLSWQRSGWRVSRHVAARARPLGTTDALDVES